jgi:THO complex subunit 2
MSTSDITRGKGEQTSGRDRHRDYQPINGNSAGSSATQSQQEGTSQAPGSLRSRIGDKEGPRSLPQPAVNTYRPDPQRLDDDRDNRKRTASGVCRACHDCSSNSFLFAQDRDNEVTDIPPGGNELMQPPKRPRIVLNRNRYTSQSHQNTSGGALARKLLETTLAEDKPRGRKDRQS